MGGQNIHGLLFCHKNLPVFDANSQKPADTPKELDLYAMNCRYKYNNQLVIAF